MAAGSLFLWAAVVAIALYCARGPRPANAQRFAAPLIVGGGVALPTAVLGVLLGFGLAPISRLTDGPRAGSHQLHVSGEQWWWRVRYITASGQPIDLANEIHLPVGERVDVTLSSANVIHSFWIPSISGKVDMIPGRRTHLSLEPTRTGLFRGTCAEYCGTSHALMAFPVVVSETDAFERWLTDQSLPAREPSMSTAVRGRDLFMSNGCGACHAIRGTPALGTVGPDLTHIGGRMSLGAGTLPNDAARLAEWIARPDHAKPGARMPAYGMLPSDQLHAMAAYLSGLR
jgi:cytochrome c oxidase subunit 2